MTRAATWEGKTKGKKGKKEKRNMGGGNPLHESKRFMSRRKGRNMALMAASAAIDLLPFSSDQLVSRALSASLSFSSTSWCPTYSSAPVHSRPHQSLPPSQNRTTAPVKARGSAGRRSAVLSWAGWRRVVGAPAAATMPAQEEVVETMDPVQQRLMFDDECILVDEKDNVVGHDSKYNCHLMEKIEAENLLHRAFSVFLFNSKNELLLQKRSATKVTFPLVWTNTCCSHPLYRDSELIKENHLGVRNAAQRKLFDELGIEAPDAPVDGFTCLGRILYKAASDGKWGEHELDYLVFMKRDVTVKPNPEEVAEVEYVTRERLQELVKKAKAGEDGIKLSPWFQLVVENFLYDWWKRLEEGTLSEVADMETIHKLV